MGKSTLPGTAPASATSAQDSSSAARHSTRLPSLDTGQRTLAVDGTEVELTPTEFNLMQSSALEFYVELPAFLLLGLLCGLVATALMHAIFLAEDVGNYVQRRIHLPRYLRPAVSGALLGLLAIWFPHIIGVGYETTTAALSGNLFLYDAVIFAILKVAAVAVKPGSG